MILSAEHAAFAAQNPVLSTATPRGREYNLDVARQTLVNTGYDNIAMRISSSPVPTAQFKTSTRTAAIPIEMPAMPARLTRSRNTRIPARTTRKRLPPLATG